MIPFLHLGPSPFPLRVDGGYRAARLAYVLQADFNRRRSQLERLPAIQGQRDEGFLIIGVAGIAGLAEPALSRFGKSQRILRRSLEFACSAGSDLLVRWISWRIDRADNNGASPENSSFTVFSIFAPRRLCRLRYRTHRLLPFRDGDYGKPTTWQWPWGVAFPHAWCLPPKRACS